MKKVLMTALGIILIASVVGLAYNFFSADPVKFKHEEKAKVHETNIFSDSTEKTVGIDQIKQYLNDPRIQFVDARAPEAFAHGKIGNAINAFPEDEDQSSYMKKLSQLPTDKVLIVYCDGGNCDLSHHVVKDLKNFGFTKVFLYAAGWDEWSQSSK